MAGTEVEQAQAFVTALCYLENRIKPFLALPMDKLQEAALRAKIREIGQAEGASSPRAGAA